MKFLIDLVTELAERSVEQHSMTDGSDTGTPAFTLPIACGSRYKTERTASNTNPEPRLRFGQLCHVIDHRPGLFMKARLGGTFHSRVLSVMLLTDKTRAERGRLPNVVSSRDRLIML